MQKRLHIGKGINKGFITIKYDRVQKLEVHIYPLQPRFITIKYDRVQKLGTNPQYWWYCFITIKYDRVQKPFASAFTGK